MIAVMKNNSNVFLLFGDLGFPRYEEFKDKFPNRAYSVGASEQTMLDIAVGLAYSKKIPFVYTITPFFYRAFETIRTYIAYENLNIKMIGAGRDDDYSKHDGYSHDAKDIQKILGVFDNIIQIYPETKKELFFAVNNAINNKAPTFLSLRR